MTPSEKEKFRWQFAGQAMQAIIEATAHYINGNTQLPQKKFMGPTALMYADAIIAELEKTAPKQERCDHEPVIWRLDDALIAAIEAGEKLYQAQSMEGLHKAREEYATVRATFDVES